MYSRRVSSSADVASTKDDGLLLWEKSVWYELEFAHIINISEEMKEWEGLEDSNKVLIYYKS
jgi:hypothetical protein